MLQLIIGICILIYKCSILTVIY